MRIEYLYRYPVKGLTAEALEEAEVEAGGASRGTAPSRWRRATRGFDPAARPGCTKRNFMCLHEATPRSPRCARRFDPRDRHADDPRAGRRRRSSANALTAAGRERIGAFLTALSGRRGARRRRAFHHVPGHVFGDQREQGGQPDQPGQPARLRGEGRRAPAPPAVPRQCLVQRRRALGELDWVGQQIQVGGADAAGDQADHRAAPRPR